MSKIKEMFSRKYLKILTYDNMVKVVRDKSEDSKDMLIIHTANGIYQGFLKDPEDFSKNYTVSENDDIVTIHRKTYLSALNKDNYDDIEEANENPITIDLEDVTLITSMKSIQMPFVSIFIDQIIGISIGCFDNKK